MYSDGGGVVTAARKPIYGAAKTARFLLGVQRKLDYEPQVGAYARVNGDPGVVILSSPDGVVTVLALELGDGVVANVRLVLNPHKLARV